MGEYVRGQGRNFYHVSSGKLKFSTGKKDEEGKTIYKDLDGYEGKLIGIEKYEDEFEGKKMNKIRLTMLDERKDNKSGEVVSEIADITLTDETFFVVGLFARLGNIDIDKPFLLGVLPSDQNSKVSFCFLKQYGKKIEKDPNFPQPEAIDLGGGKKAYKYTKTTAEVDKMIAEIQDYLKTTNMEELPVEADEEKAF